MIKKLKTYYNKVPIQAKLAFWTFVCSCIQKGISIITVPIFTRLLTTEQYGQYSVYMSWLNVMGIFTSLRLYAGVYNKGLSKYKEDMDGYALSMQYTTTILSGIVLIVYLIFHKPLNSLMDLTTPFVLLMILELCMTTPLQFWSIRQRYDFKYKGVVAATLSLAIANPVLGLIAVQLTEEKGYARIVSAAIAQICIGLIFYTVNLIKGKFKFNVEYSKFALKFNFPLLPHYFSEYILNQSDRIMIQKIVGYSEAAIYSVAYNAGMIMTIVSSSINQALVPWLYQTLDKRNYKEIKQTTNLVGLLVAVALALFILVTPEATWILGGDEYEAAKYIMAPVTASVYFLFWYTLFANVEFYYDKNKFTMFVSMFGAVLNLILNLIFINLFGYMAAAYTSLVCYIVYSVGHYLFMDRVFYKNEQCHLFDVKIFILISVVLLIFMFGAMMLYDYPIPRYAILAASAIVIIVKRKTLIQFVRKFSKKKKVD